MLQKILEILSGSEKLLDLILDQDAIKINNEDLDDNETSEINNDIEEELSDEQERD